MQQPTVLYAGGRYYKGLPVSYSIFQPSIVDFFFNTVMVVVALTDSVVCVGQYFILLLAVSANNCTASGYILYKFSNQISSIFLILKRNIETETHKSATVAHEGQALI